MGNFRGPIARRRWRPSYYFIVLSRWKPLTIRTTRLSHVRYDFRVFQRNQMALCPTLHGPDTSSKKKKKNKQTRRHRNVIYVLATFCFRFELYYYTSYYIHEYSIDICSFERVLAPVTLVSDKRTSYVFSRVVRDQ